MTWEDIFNKVIVALDEAESTSLQTNLEDYKNKIYECADSCQRELAAFASQIKKRAEVESIDGIIDLPENCYEPLGLFDSEGKRVSFKVYEKNKLEAEDGTYSLLFNAYPARFTKDTDLKSSPETSEEAQEALVYGTCAEICINDEPELYSIYMSRYNGLVDLIVQRREQRPTATISGGIRL